MMVQRKDRGFWPLLGGIIAAVAASSCCLGPLVLVMLGIGGAWVAHLSALEAYRPLFLGISVLFLIFAYRKIYRAPSTDVCEAGTLCAMPQTRRIYKFLFWIVAVLIGLAVAFPYLAPLFY